MFADYEKGLLQLTSSIRQYAGLETYHDCDKEATDWLNKHQFNKIMLVLIDGMGSKLLERNLDEKSFLRSHMVKEITTLFPPTTSAVTTSIETGKSPMENGWLGWNQYFKEIDDNLILFFNEQMYGDKKYPGFVEKTIPIHQMTEDEGVIQLAPYGENPYKSTPDFIDKLIKLSFSDKHLIYGYYSDLDGLMHKVGPSDKKVHELFIELNMELERLAAHISEDCALIIIADHGQVDIDENIDLKNYPDVMECFYAKPAIEPRCLALYVKDEYKDVFPEIFNKHFKDEFTLYTKEEVLKMHLFGTGKPSERFEDFVGDFLAITSGHKCLGYDIWTFAGQHAGNSEDEMMIPVILYPEGE